MKRILSLLVAIAVVTGAGVVEAQNAPLKGKWIFTLAFTTGTIPVPVRFKSDGDGEITFPQDSVPMVYREDIPTGRFSIAAELTATMSPSGQPLTMVLRGSKSSDDVASGSIFVITDSPTPLFLPAGTFTASRQ